jgi:hypothetical protein
VSFVAVSAGVGAASLGVGIYKSIKQGHQASQIDKNNQRPTYDIPQEYKDNAAYAKQMAGVGLPQQQYNNQLNAINRNQAGGIFTLSRSANPGANLAALVRAGNDANGNLNAQDAAARQSNMRLFLGQNAALGQQRLAQQQYNKFDKYTEDYNKAAALRGASNQNLNNAVSGAAGMATGLASMENGGMGNSTVAAPSMSAINNAADLGSKYATNGIMGAEQNFNQYLGQPKYPYYSNWQTNPMNY